jgi:hypothetical protein
MAYRDRRRVVMLGLMPSEPYSDPEWLVPATDDGGSDVGVARLVRRLGRWQRFA